MFWCCGCCLRNKFIYFFSFAFRCISNFSELNFGFFLTLCRIAIKKNKINTHSTASAKNPPNKKTESELKLMLFYVYFIYRQILRFYFQ